MDDGKEDNYDHVSLSVRNELRPSCTQCSGSGVTVEETAHRGLLR